MMKAIGTIAVTLAALLPAAGMKEKIKQPLADKADKAAVRVLPHKSAPVDGDYTVDGEMNVSADEHYKQLKAALDERFAYMFELKAALENAQGIMSAKWEEYYAMHEKYNRELKKIVGAWVTEQNYSEK